MNPYIEATIQEIEGRIGILNDLAQKLRWLDSVDSAPRAALPASVASMADGLRARRNGGKGNGRAKRTVPAGTVVKGLKLIDAMREGCAKMNGEFTADRLRSWIESNHPHLAKRLGAVSVNLIDMSNRGELHRNGSRGGAKYRVAKLKNPARVEAAYQQFRQSIETTPATGD